MRKFVKFFGALTAIFVLAAVGGFVFSGTERAGIAQAEITECSLKTRYVYGETVEIPSAKIVYDGDTLDAVCKYVRFPDDRVTDRTELTLNQVGRYEICYVAEKNGEIISESYKFDVLNEVFSVSDGKSSVSYGTHPYTPNTEGLTVKLAKGDVFTYNRAIDVTDKTAYDDIFKFYVTPNQIGACDSSQIRIRLTDAYDESNYVEMLLKNASHLGAWADIAAYCVGNAANQTPMGMYLGKPRSDWAGYVTYFSLCGKSFLDVSLDSYQFGFCLDYAERQLIADCRTERGFERGLVIDLDDPTIQTQTWKGFTTGECFLSIEGLRYQANDLNFVITQLSGIDLREKNFQTENTPIISIDYGENTEDALPYAKVGKAFTLFDATATSMYQKNIKVISDVYFNYDLVPVNVSVTGGSFTPTREGVYTILYKAKDRYGFVSEKRVDILALKQDGLTLELIGKTTNCTIAQDTKICSEFVVKNASGKANFDIKAIGEKATYFIGEDLTFYPEYSGIYTIEIVCSDYLETVGTSFEIEVEKANILTSKLEVFVPQYMIRNATYPLQTLDVFDYSDGSPRKVVLDCYVSEDGKSPVKAVGTYTVNAESTVKIIYRESGGAYERSYDAEVVDTGYGSGLSLKKYFIADSVKTVIDFDSTDALTFTATGNGKIRFINAVDVTDLTISFNAIEGFADFDKLNIYLIDPVTAERVKFTYVNAVPNAWFYVNDGAGFDFGSAFQGAVSGAFRLGFKAETGNATPNSIDYRTAISYESGKEYNGFFNNLAYIEFEFEGVYGNGGLQLYNINKQVFANIARDIFGPNIYAESLVGDKELGDEVVIKSAHAHDILDPMVTLILQITAPDGEYYRDDSGNVFDGTASVEKDYTIVLNEYGDYTFSWTATDGSGRSTVYSFGITVIDSEPPVIKLADVKYTAKVGDKLELPSFKATDNITPISEVEKYVFLQSEKLEMIDVTVDPYVFSAAGIYRVIFYAFDAVGNSACIEYTLTVS